MRKVYKTKKRSRASCKSHKMGREKRWRVKEAELIKEFEKMKKELTR